MNTLWRRSPGATFGATSLISQEQLWLLVTLTWVCSALPAVEAAAAPPDPPQTVKVAAIQCSSVLGNVAANSKKLTGLVKEAATNGAKIIVLPEAAITGYLSQDLKTNWHVQGLPIEPQFIGLHPEGFAETVPGSSTKRFCKLAGELGVYLTIPLVEVDFDEGKDKPRYFNTVCLASPRGELVAHYRKLNPWPVPEKSWATAGDRGVQTYDTEYGRVGLGICFDIHTILEKYEGKELWALLYPIAWVDAEHPAEWFFHRLPERVRPFKHHLIGANWSVDDKQNWRGYGFSVIILGSGKVVASAKSLYGSEIVYAELPAGKRKKQSGLAADAVVTLRELVTNSNRSGPVRSETNRTSAAAGSGR